jgi:hypothetical protein
VPIGGPAVQHGLELRLIADEVGAEHLRQERVATKPRVGAIDRLDGDVAAREAGQHRGGVAGFQHGVAQRRGQSREDRGAAQERELVLCQIAEHLVTDVGGEQPIAPTELVDRLRRAILLLDRQRGEVQADGPSLRQGHQPIDLAGFEPDARAVEQHRRLEPRHGQLARSELHEQTVAAKPGERHGEAPARRDGDA